MSRVSYSATINATPAHIWAIMTDVTRLPEWSYTEGRFPYPVEGQYGSEQKEGVGVIWVGISSDGQKATQKITAWEPAQKLAYELQEMENAALPMTQTNTFELEPANDHTKITWTLDWELTGGFSLSKLLIRLTGKGAFEEMMAGSLEKLRLLVETPAPTDTKS